MYRRRTVRPATHRALLVITFVLAVIVWVCWEAGRVICRLGWSRTLVATASGLTFVLFAIGDYLY